MDLIEYGGVQFPVTRSIGTERENILDPSGSTYLYTRWRGNYVVTYNPGAIAYRPGPLATKAGVAPGAPLAGPYRAGIMPASTDFAIRAWINKPRRLLRIWSGDVLVIQSPLIINGVVAACDAATGPILKANDIVFIPGERRWDIHLSIETSFIDPTFASGTLPPVISNRWYAIGETDFQQKLVRAYQGLVTVRGDWLRSSGGNPTTIDQLRSTFAAFTVPQGFQRVTVNVRAMPDGNSAEYTVVDAQQMWNKDARASKADRQQGNTCRVCPALRLEIQDSAWVSQVAGLNVVPNGPALLLGLGLLTGLGGIAQTALGSLVPKGYRRVQVRAWGASTMNRAIIAKFCLNVASARLGVLAEFDVATEETMCVQDTSNYVEVTKTRSWDFGTLGAIAFLAADFALEQAGAASSRGAATARNAMTDNPDYLYCPEPGAGAPPRPFIPVPVQPTPGIGPIMQPNLERDFVQAFPQWAWGQTHRGLTVNPAFLDAGTRGTYLESLVTQVLEDPDTLPSSPP